MKKQKSKSKTRKQVRKIAIKAEEQKKRHQAKKAAAQPLDPDSLVAVRNLSVDFKSSKRTTHAVKNISFDIKPGETVALVGESGSGKTVSALSIMRLLPYPAASHPSGEIFFKGEDLLKIRGKQLRQYRGNAISMIFQEPMSSLNPLHQIEQQIGEVLELHRGLSGNAARARVLDLLHTVGIKDPEQGLER